MGLTQLPSAKMAAAGEGEEDGEGERMDYKGEEGIPGGLAKLRSIVHRPLRLRGPFANKLSVQSVEVMRYRGGRGLKRAEHAKNLEGEETYKDVHCTQVYVAVATSVLHVHAGADAGFFYGGGTVNKSYKKWA